MPTTLCRAGPGTITRASRQDQADGGVRRLFHYLLFFIVMAVALPQLQAMLVRPQPSALWWEYANENDGFSDKLFIDSMRRYAVAGDRDVGGFMVAFQKNVHIAAVEAIDGAKGKRRIYPYISNFSLQYSLGKMLMLGRPERAFLAIAATSLFSALAMALVAAGIAVFAERRFGRWSGFAVALTFALSPMMATRALSPYWLIVLSFLPFFAMLALYRPMAERRRFPALAALAGGLVGLKALTGYEYLSNVALGAALPILFFEIEAAGGRLDKAAVTRALSRGLMLGGCAVAGFAVAVALHVAKAAAFFGSLGKGIQAFVLPFTYSTMQSSSGIRGDVPVSPATVLETARITFFEMNWPVTLPLYVALTLTSIALIARHGGSPRRLWESLGPTPRALAFTLLASVPVSVSWVVLAERHSVAHPHINWILGYLFVHLFAAMQLGQNVRLLAARASMGRQSRFVDEVAHGR